MGELERRKKGELVRKKKYSGSKNGVSGGDDNAVVVDFECAIWPELFHG